MLFFAIIIGLFNVVGGRWDDITGAKDSPGGRLLFRCLLPSLVSGFIMLPDISSAFYVLLAVLAGSALWFPFGWSFDEITGEYDKDKYHSFVRKIGLYFFPYNSLRKTNMRRGILTKGLRGMYDSGTFILLSFINPYALLCIPFTALMGVAYHVPRYILPERHVVIAGEFIWGLCRGLMIYYACRGAISY